MQNMVEQSVCRAAKLLSLREYLGWHYIHTSVDLSHPPHPLYA
jgi:hypothetical protein